MLLLLFLSFWLYFSCGVDSQSQNNIWLYPPNDNGRTVSDPDSGLSFIPGTTCTLRWLTDYKSFSIVLYSAPMAEDDFVTSFLDSKTQLGSYSWNVSLDPQIYNLYQPNIFSFVISEADGSASFGSQNFTILAVSVISTSFIAPTAPIQSSSIAMSVLPTSPGISSTIITTSSAVSSSAGNFYSTTNATSSSVTPASSLATSTFPSARGILSSIASTSTAMNTALSTSPTSISSLDAGTSTRSKKVGLGIGLGIGVPIALLGALAGLTLGKRRRTTSSHSRNEQPPNLAGIAVPDAPGIASPDLEKR